MAACSKPLCRSRFCSGRKSALPPRCLDPVQLPRFLLLRPALGNSPVCFSARAALRDSPSGAGAVQAIEDSPAKGSPGGTAAPLQPKSAKHRAGKSPLRARGGQGRGRGRGGALTKAQTTCAATGRGRAGKTGPEPETAAAAKPQGCNQLLRPGLLEANQSAAQKHEAVFPV